MSEKISLKWIILISLILPLVVSILTAEYVANRSEEQFEEELALQKEQLDLFNKSLLMNADISFTVVPEQPAEYLVSRYPIASKRNPIVLKSDDLNTLEIIIMNKGRNVAQLIRLSITKVQDNTTIGARYFQDLNPWVLGPQEYQRIPVILGRGTISSYGLGEAELIITIDFDEGVISKSVFVDVH